VGGAGCASPRLRARPPPGPAALFGSPLAVVRRACDAPSLSARGAHVSSPWWLAERAAMLASSAARPPLARTAAVDRADTAACSSERRAASAAAGVRGTPAPGPAWPAGAAPVVAAPPLRAAVG